MTDESESPEYVPEFTKKVLRHIDGISSQDSPQFTYIHIAGPGHSSMIEPTYADLASFRKGYVQKIQIANNQTLGIVQYVLDHDPRALIILNADHGPFGFGFNTRGTNKVVKGIPDKLIGLDNLGVLLTIRWPHGAKKDVQGIKTNVNLFRHIFSYLSDSDMLLAALVDDHGFITKGKSKDMTLLKVAHDGRILGHMVEMGLVH